MAGPHQQGEVRDSHDSSLRIDRFREKKINAIKLKDNSDY
jgi:hypothetical protein